MVGSFCTRTAFARATDEIDMDVCFKNVRDRHLLLASELHAAVKVRTWIEHCGYAFGIIVDQIGKLGNSNGLDAFKNE